MQGVILTCGLGTINLERYPAWLVLLGATFGEVIVGLERPPIFGGRKGCWIPWSQVVRARRIGAMDRLYFVHISRFFRFLPRTFNGLLAASLLGALAMHD